MIYDQIAIGIDQSYKNTGISIVADGCIRDIKSIRLDKCSCHAERREVLRGQLEYLFRIVTVRAEKVVCIVERSRIHGGEKSLISLDAIKSMSTLTAVTVDAAYEYGVKVYSVDTRSWKSQVVGTSKPMPNKYGVPPEKWPTVKWVIHNGFEDKILVDVTDTRKSKGTFIRSGRKYQYNDDAADSAGIGMFWFCGKHENLKEEK